MKLLFDQNISHRIVKEISAFFPDSKQVREVGLEGFTDREIWTFAKKNKFCIVTFDGDFADLATLFHFPPKVIWLKFGNSSTKKIAAELISRIDQIHDFLEDDSEGILKIEAGF